jgi:hypothetical protein
MAKDSVNHKLVGTALQVLMIVLLIYNAKCELWREALFGIKIE